MKTWERLIVKASASIKEVLNVLDHTESHIVLVIDDKDSLIGTITDGDVRRGILSGKELSAAASEVMCKEFTYVGSEMQGSSVLSLMKQNSIKQIPVLDKNKKVIGLHLIDDFLEKEIFKNPVVIMAGGLGSRLKPLTDACPKPMLKVGDHPILEIIIRNLVLQGFNDFYISINYLGDQIKQYFGDGSKFDANITYLEEKEKLGTAGALGMLSGDIDQTVIVMNGDILTQVDFANLLSFHNLNKSDITVCMRKYEVEIPYGVLSLQDADIVDIVEKPIYGHYVSAGIYAISPSVISSIGSGQYLDMPNLLAHAMQDNRKVTGFPLHEYWMDIGMHSEYQQAHIDYSDHFGKK